MCGRFKTFLLPGPATAASFKFKQFFVLNPSPRNSQANLNPLLLIFFSAASHCFLLSLRFSLLQRQRQGGGKRRELRREEAPRPTQKGLASGSGSTSRRLACHSCGGVGGQRDRAAVFFSPAVSVRRLLGSGVNWRRVGAVWSGFGAAGPEIPWNRGSAVTREAVAGAACRPAGDGVSGCEVRAEVGGAAAARARQAAAGAVDAARLQVLLPGERRWPGVERRGAPGCCDGGGRGGSGG